MQNKSWKTSAAGLGAILAAIGVVGAQITAFANGNDVDFAALGLAVSAISAGVGGLFARDNDVTSRQAGAE